MIQQRIIDRTMVGEILQHIYTSGLGVQLTLFSEKGYFYIGHGDKKTPLRGTTIEEAVTHLAIRLVNEFPKSEFASWWNTHFKEVQQA